ncbi:MAG: DUF2249 domain-containing protein [Lacibacter sp.]|nr:DUF2249 domain-containing protein [Lacibacter sp.]
MKINAHTRIKTLLDHDQDRVMEQLIKLNSNFSKLRNPILRNLLARRVTIADACKVAKCKMEDFLDSMQQIGFIIEETVTTPLLTKPNTIDLTHKTRVMELDARSYLEQKKDPLKEILGMANRMGIGDRLKVINSFEPVPLISLLTDKGFLNQTQYIAEDVVVTWFEKTIPLAVSIPKLSDPSSATEEVFDLVLQSFPQEKIKYIDVRELEMPQPMIQILAKIDTLNEDELLYVYHKKLPVYLIPELNNRGFKFLINHTSDNALDILIYR